MPDTHEERIRAAFTPQAATFEDARLNVAFTSSVPWLLDHMAAGVDDIARRCRRTGIVAGSGRLCCSSCRRRDSTPAVERAVDTWPPNG
jgi:hypothetical protein